MSVKNVLITSSLNKSQIIEFMTLTITNYTGYIFTCHEWLIFQFPTSNKCLDRVQPLTASYDP